MSESQSHRITEILRSFGLLHDAIDGRTEALGGAELVGVDNGIE